MSSSVQEVDIAFVQGSDLALTFRYSSRDPDTGVKTPIDITGMRATFALSKGANVSPPLLEYDTDNADPELTLGGPDSNDVILRVPGSVTNALPFAGRQQRWRYECKLYLAADEVATMGIGDAYATPKVPTS